MARSEISENEASALLKGVGLEASVVVHDNGLVTGLAILGTNVGPVERQRIQAEVDDRLQEIQRQYHIVKRKPTARWRLPGG